MSDHLPECDPIPYERYCICDRLRACEQRVLAEQTRRGKGAGGYMEYGYAAGLDAARDAVVAVSVGGQHFWAVGFRDGTEQALAAIDALRGSGNPDTPPSAEKGEQA